MDIFEITGYKSGVVRDGVNYLEPSDSFSDIVNGFIYRQVLQSRRGIGAFAPILPGDGVTAATRVTGIFEHITGDTKELLVTDKNFLYKYNEGTGLFTYVPFAGGLAAYAGFGLTANNYYISGTTYPDKNNVSRFIFTCEGITLSAGHGVFFYDGTDVKIWTDVADNPDYQTFSGLTLNRARHVLYFGERINFILPEMSSKIYYQGILFSAIRSAAGNGDKFNTSGAGLIQLDTAENIVGASILGQWIALNLTRSSWTLEKTKDVFNPYYPRKIPSVLGTNAPFSFSQWNGKVITLGNTGIIAMDSQRSGTIDDKIPYFTRDEIEPTQFDYSYGGFDRIKGQFLFSYVDSTNGDTTQDKVLCYSYEEESWSVFDLRLTVFGQTDAGQSLIWNNIDETYESSWASWDTTEEVWNYIGVSKSVDKTLAGNDYGYVYELNRDYDDYFEPISAISQAVQAVVTTSGINFKAGDLVAIQGVTDMVEINNFDPALDVLTGNYYEVISSTASNVTINVDSRLFTPYVAGGGNISKVISFSAKTNPFNPYRQQGFKCYISMIEFLINSDSGSMYVDVLVDEEQTPVRSQVEIKPYETLKERNWVEMSVNQEADFFTFIFSHKSVSQQIQITSVRIHAKQGAKTYG